MPSNPYDKYKEQSVMTMTHGEMLVKLYEETVKQLQIGIRSIGEGNIAGANNALQRAQAIIGYLQSTLDFKYEISQNLSSLYAFFNEQIKMANIRKVAAPLEELIPLVEELKDAFVQGEKLTRMGKSTPEFRVG